MAALCVCLREVMQVSGQWKHGKAGGRIKTKEGATAIVQARNDGAGVTDSTKASSSAAE